MYSILFINFAQVDDYWPAIVSMSPRLKCSALPAVHMQKLALKIFKYIIYEVFKVFSNIQLLYSFRVWMA